MSSLRISSVLVGLFLSTAAACAPATADESSSEAEIGSAATISFDGSFRHSVSGGQLEAGRSVKVSYDAARLPKCRGQQGDIEQWTITGFYKIEDGPVKTFTVAGLGQSGQPSTIALDRPGDLEIWFQNTGRSGCSEFDSAFGENYHFEVL